MSIFKQTAFGSINLLTGLESYDENGKLTFSLILKKLKQTLSIVFENYNYWLEVYKQLLNDENIGRINTDDRFELTMSLQYGMNNYCTLIEDFSEIIEKIENCKDERELRTLVPHSLYKSTVLLIHIYELEQQYKNQSVIRLTRVAQLQNGKKQAKTRRIENLPKDLKNIDDIVKWIDNSYSTWWQVWKKHKTKPSDLTKQSFSLIPKHIQSWFKQIDKEGVSTQKKSVSYYWKMHPKTTQNWLIRQILDKISKNL